MKIGFFDTGLGGATIFKEAYKEINGDFIYLADIKNSPYGVKDFETVKVLTEQNIVTLMNLGCKIIVLACNTATSAAISFLRLKYPDIIFIGAEPAIKPALENCNNMKILLTATSLTLKGNKLFHLLTKLNGVNNVELLPLDELVEFADESSKIRYDLAEEYLNQKFSKYNFDNFSGIVLGCTHFPIFKDVFRSILPKHMEIYDSSDGITNNLTKKIHKLDPNYNIKFKKFELVLTEESSIFRKKFNDFIFLKEK